MSLPTPSADIPTTQKAWVVIKQGKPRQALDFKADFPVPTPKSGHVLVKVRAAALNPVGYKLMGVLPNFLSARPHPAEHDFAGVVVDANGSRFSNGDEIIGFIPVSLQSSTRQGALAQYVTLPASNVVLKPTKLSWEEAAGIPLAAQTALQSLQLGGYKLEEPDQSPSGTSETTSQETIFINGGSTAVGIYAIQIAKAMGFRVVASASGRNENFVRSIGADEFIDYKTQPLPAYLISNPPNPRFAMILDAAGLFDTALYTKSEAYLAPSSGKKGGVYVSTGPWPIGLGWGKIITGVGKMMAATGWPSWLGGVKRGWKVARLEHKLADLEQLCDMVERGTLRPYVDSTYAFGSALDAYDKIMTGRAVGKVVVMVG
ncbi:chaperonin 10-like protein [Melanogaster broomeanus]|nr:chaperonin 10-like protein [Melanogaster broomeanus]